MLAFLRTMVIRSTVQEPAEPPKTLNSESKQTTEDNSVHATARESQSATGEPSSKVTSKPEAKPSGSHPVDKLKVEQKAEASKETTDAKDTPVKKPESGTSDTPVDTTEEDLDHPLQWMVRTCNFYYEEYRECKRWKGRFQQWFVHGAYEDCSPHKEQYNNCTLWKSKGDQKALEDLIAYERGKIRHRIRSHLANDVWENREKAPEDWNKPLPADIAKEYETSFLGTKKADFEKDSRREHIYDDQTLYADDGTCAIV